MHVLVINLDRCPERLVSTVHELERIGMSATRIPAVDGRNLVLDESGDIPGFKKRGRARENYYRGIAGCYFSHIRALQHAIDADQWPCLIVEDDILIVGDGPLLLPDTSKEVIYFGGLDTPSTIYGTHAICYKTKEAATMALGHLVTHPGSPDHSLIQLWKRIGQPHYARPYRIWQCDGYSLISEKVMYRFSSKNPTP